MGAAWGLVRGLLQGEATQLTRHIARSDPI